MLLSDDLLSDNLLSTCAVADVSQERNLGAKRKPNMSRIGIVNNYLEIMILGRNDNNFILNSTH